MRIIFLDIDGVLNNLRDVHEGHESIFGRRDHTAWRPFHCAALAQIVERTDARIVISSTWRKHAGCDADWWNAEFSKVGIPMNCIGVTGGSRNGFRGREVNEWLAAHPEVVHYVILDDESDFYPEQPRIHVNMYTGLREHHVGPAVALLNGAAFVPLDCIEERNPPEV